MIENELNESYYASGGEELERIIVEAKKTKEERLSAEKMECLRYFFSLCDKK